MALQNPSQLYSGAAERLNVQPHVNYQIGLMAKKKAHDEALDKYYQNLPNTINEKGIRDTEIPIINDLKGKIYEYGVKNREQLRNPKLDNGASQQTLNKMFREAQSIAMESKNRADAAKKLWEMKKNPANDYIFRNPAIKDTIFSHDLPVGAEGSQSMDLNQLSLPPKPFEPQKYFKDFADIKYDYGTPKIEPHPSDKYLQVETQIPTLSQEAKNVIATRAADRYMADISFETEIKEKLAKNPKMVEELTKVYQENYGKPIESEFDLATAYTIAGLPKAQAKTRTIPNFGTRLGAQESKEKRMASFKDNLTRNRMKFKKALTEQDQNTVLNDIIADQYNKGGVEGSVDTPLGKLTVRKVIVPIEIKDKYVLDKGFKTEKQPTDFYMTKDKKYVIPIYRDDNGNINTELSQPILMNSYKAQLGNLMLGKSKNLSELEDDIEVEGDLETEDYIPQAKPATKEAKPQKPTQQKQKIAGW